jgi:hypothetical protein
MLRRLTARARSLWHGLRRREDVERDMPLRADLADSESDGIHVFGRLADGATLETARAELTTVGQRLAAAFPPAQRRARARSRCAPRWARAVGAS